jgi:hypothetical protein
MRYWSPIGAFGRELAEQRYSASLGRLCGHGFGRRWITVKLGMTFERDVVTRDGWPYRLYRLTHERWSSQREAR